MSTKTLRKRIALVAVAALGAGVLSVAPASAATHPIAGADNMAAADGVLSVATKASVTGSAVSSDKEDGSTNRSTGLLYKDSTTGTAQSATVLSTGALALFTLATTDVAFVASGGTFSGLAATSVATTGIVSADRKTVVLLDAAANLAAGVTWSSSTAGTYQISMYSNTAIDGLTTASSGTLTGLLTVTVTATSSVGTYSAVDSACALQATHGAITTATLDDPAASKLANAAKGYVTVDLRDAYGVALAAGALVATATNGAFVSLADNSTVGTGSTAVSAAAPTDLSVVVSQPTANAPVSTTVTVTYNGTVVCTKTLTIVGEVASMKASDVITGALNGANAAAFYVQTFDAAGNLVVPRAAAAFAAIPATLNSTVSAASISAAATMMTGDTSAAYSTGTFTCGATAGSSSIKLGYQNASGTVVVSPAIAVRCAGNADTYTAAFDKAAYVQGEIATLTVQFKDVNGNNANSYGSTGASTAVVTTPMLTMIGAAASDTLPDVNGVVKIKFTVGGNTAVTAGSYNALVDYPTLTADNATIQTVAYKVGTGDTGVTNADVLKAIVSLIASINKQIAALQKALLKK
jgi:hypothetical protein